MKIEIKITPELRMRLMHAETLDITEIIKGFELKLITSAREEIREVSKHAEEWLCCSCQTVFPYESLQHGSSFNFRCPKGCNDLVRPSSRSLRMAQELIFDSIRGEQDQAHKHARRYLKMNRPDLLEKLEAR